MPVREIFKQIREYLGIFNPRNIISEHDKKFLIAENSIKQQCDNMRLESTGSRELTNEIDMDLMQRTQTRFLTQELRKQKNIEQILKKAEKHLENEQIDSKENVSKPLNEDWLSYYIEGASKISDDQVQELWAKILAGEIITPRTFSRRTLDVLLRLSAEEANLFKKICGYVVEIENNHVLINSEKLNSVDCFTYIEIMRLIECGLINSSITNNLTANIVPSQKFAIVYGKYIIIGEPTKQENIHIQIFPLTVTGIELLKIISPIRTGSYLSNLIKYLKNNYQNMQWKSYQIFKREGQTIHYVKIDMDLTINLINH